MRGWYMNSISGYVSVHVKMHLVYSGCELTMGLISGFKAEK